MPIKTQIPYDNGHYFITFTCYRWLPLIAITNGYDLIYNWFHILKSNGHYVTGFVIMPNHIHVTVAFRKTSKSINKIIGDGKRFIGYAIIKRLKEKCCTDLLLQLEGAANKSDRKRGKLYELWEDSFDWKECRGDDFIWQKINYMHENPCSGKWNISPNAIDYVHSSAKFYLTGIHADYAVINFKTLNDIDLTTL